ncbi:hypothetical protein BJV77DRAFT_1036248 [Russula vinacea]|nr:hypothetical protein BJV77DRAFT_1036248 [Russula vinacea]
MTTPSASLGFGLPEKNGGFADEREWERVKDDTVLGRPRRLHYNQVSGDDSFFGSHVFRYAILSHPRFLICKPSDIPLSFSLPRTTFFL